MTPRNEVIIRAFKEFPKFGRGLPKGENDCYLGIEYSRVGSGKRASEWRYSQSCIHLLHYISISKVY